MKTRLFIAACIALHIWGCSNGEHENEADAKADFVIGETAKGACDDKELPNNTRTILSKYCADCHGPNSGKLGGFGTVLDAKAMTIGDNALVKAGKVAESRLFTKLKAAGGNMPLSADDLSKDEVDTLRDWINCGAESWDEECTRKFISNEEMHKIMADDLSSLAAEERKNIRYITLTHLYNACVNRDQLDIYRTGISKLVNSLSWTKGIFKPVPVGKFGTIYRINLSLYGWLPGQTSEKGMWELIEKAYPYGFKVEKGIDNDFSEVVSQTKTNTPYVHADWFANRAGKPPLYHALLNLPLTDTELEKDFLSVDVLSNIKKTEQGNKNASTRVIRAAVQDSGVSNHNRMIERHKSKYGWYWKSYDFAGSVGKQDLEQNPLGPNETPVTFEHDGGEMIFTLPNGLDGYLVTNAASCRIDVAPTAIVSDPKSQDKAVRPGSSCMGCHYKGKIPAADFVRDSITSKKQQFITEHGQKAFQAVLNLYPPKKEFSAAINQEQQDFLKQLALAGVDPSKDEPVSALANSFEDQLDKVKIAATLGIDPKEIENFLKFDAVASSLIGSVRKDGETIPRDKFCTYFSAILNQKNGTFAGYTPLADVKVCQPPKDVAGCLQNECLKDADCNSKDECTVGSCNIQKGCVFTPIAKICDDGNQCTTDKCITGTPKKCTHTPTPNASCNADNNVCTKFDSCSDSGVCKAGEQKVCPKPVNPCEKQKCDSKIGCAVDILPNGTSCPGGLCHSGKCVLAAKQISAGDLFTCAVTLNDTVVCWGLNKFGQLGNGSKVLNTSVPVHVKGLTNVESVSAGVSHACAIKKDKTLWCWGFNNYGQLSVGSNKGSPIPVNIPSMKVNQVGIGNSHTCALNTTGSVYCWGDNSYGQLGTDTKVLKNSHKPVLASSGIEQIALGPQHSCAIQSSNGVSCWGRNQYGQLGNGSKDDTHITYKWKNLALPTFIDAGYLNTCAIKSNSSLYCWGSNIHGKLGVGSTKAGEVLTHVLATAVPTDVTDVSIGRHHVCVKTKKNKFHCWGSNKDGQVGFNPQFIHKKEFLFPLAMGSGKQISTRNSHTCAIMDDKTVKCWGFNSLGQIGHGKTGGSVIGPVHVLPPK